MRRRRENGRLQERSSERAVSARLCLSDVQKDDRRVPPACLTRVQSRVRSTGRKAKSLTLRAFLFHTRKRGGFEGEGARFRLVFAGETSRRPSLPRCPPGIQSRVSSTGEGEVLNSTRLPPPRATGRLRGRESVLEDEDKKLLDSSVSFGRVLGGIDRPLRGRSA